MPRRGLFELVCSAVLVLQAVTAMGSEMNLYMVQEYLGVLLVLAVSLAILFVLAVASVLSLEMFAWLFFGRKTKVDPPSAPRTSQTL
jgi:hypothetical protein